MALLGEAAIAMWWEMDPSMRREFEHWHSHEHFPERLSIPGFLRGSRWAQTDGGNGFFIMYELDRYATLSSPHYLERLNKPTPWSTKLMPYHANMVRSQCRVLESRGGATARYALTLRLSPSPEKESELRAYLKTFFEKRCGKQVSLLPICCIPKLQQSHKLRNKRSEAAMTKALTGS